MHLYLNESRYICFRNLFRWVTLLLICLQVFHKCVAALLRIHSHCCSWPDTVPGSRGTLPNLTQTIPAFLQHTLQQGGQILNKPDGSAAKIPPAMQEPQVQSLGWEDPLEEEMATHSSILAWRIPWTEEPGELQSIGSQRVRHD